MTTIIRVIVQTCIKISKIVTSLSYIAAAIGTIWMATESHRLAQISLYEPKIKIEQVRFEECETFDPTRNRSFWINSSIDLTMHPYESRRRIIIKIINSGNLAAISTIDITSCEIDLEFNSLIGPYAVMIDNYLPQIDWEIERRSYSEKNFYNISIKKPIMVNDTIDIIFFYYKTRGDTFTITQKNLAQYLKIKAWSPLTRFAQADFWGKK